MSANMHMQTVVAEKEKMVKRAKDEGATIIEVPLPNNPGAIRNAGIPAEAIGQMANIVATDADSLRAKNPTLSDDIIRAMIVTNGGVKLERFFRKYPAIFHTFTSRETQGEVRGRMLQVIKLKMKLEQGEISPDESHNLLSDLFGVNAEKRAELKEQLEKMANRTATEN